MKRLILLIWFAGGCMQPSSSCSEKNSSNSFQFIGSTPGDATIKTIMGIDTASSIHFMRWDLRLQPNSKETGNFVLILRYGLSKPNTQDFIDGGEKRIIKGRYEHNGSIIHFMGNQAQFSLRKIDENVFHLLNVKWELMQGNAGWSYTLCRAHPLVTSTNIPIHSSFLNKDNDTATTIEFTGRTPCQEIAQQMNWKVSKECWKMKWVLTLKRDPVTLEPAGFIMRQTNISGERIQGKWEIDKTKQGNILSLIINNTTPPLDLLIGGEYVLFILDNQRRPLPGNSEFSFTLNRD
ncbi:hypothetical protein [Pseudoflavitalea rhizosphaerae]|uniref:hypothetical protein n=1 Tax=Pseudoflavitalea rhizosphaerae TaxID=1884793 RepID=UPI000F8C67B5|nr:hypothetical protein [Pseudoflavitalea rhizosphaerae]